MELTYQSARIHFTSQGIGRPLVLLHGFLESSRIWEPFVKKWAETRNVICIDLPGHGQSEVVEEVHAMELFAEVVHQVVTELGISKVDLLGHSMGGYVGLAYLEQHPKKVGKLILVNSSPASDSEERKKTRERAAALVYKNKSAFVSMAINNLLSPDNYDRFKVYLENMKKEALEFPAHGLAAALYGMKNRRDRTDVLKGFTGGKYIIVGKEDPILSIEAVRKQSVEAEALLNELPGGHLSFLECEQDFKEIVQLID